MAEHKHGTMDTKVQESTFDGFIKFGTWFGVAVIVLLILMAIFIS